MEAFYRAAIKMTSSFVSELDRTPEIDANNRQYYKELIGIMIWATELVRFEILLEASMLS